VYTLPPVKGSNLTVLEPPTRCLHAKWSPLIAEPSRVAAAMADIRIGTFAFMGEGWTGSFYPQGMQPRDFLSNYATQFATVEVDSTF